MKITDLYIYPIKSLHPLRVERAQLRREGPEWDRRFMLLKVNDGEEKEDKKYTNIQVVRFPQCTLFHQVIEGSEIVVTYHGDLNDVKDENPSSALHVPLEPDIKGCSTVHIKLFNSPADVYRMGEPYDAWFSARFGYPVILVYIGDSRRSVLAHLPSEKEGGAEDGVLAQQQQQQGWLSTFASYLFGEKAPDNKFLTFNEAAPYLVTSRASMRDVNSRLPEGEESDIIVMRPNIVLDDDDGNKLQPWEEDYWRELQISLSGSGSDGPRLVMTANCGRCQSLNVDYDKGRPADGERGQVLRRLMAYRRVDPGNKWSPSFGRYAFLQPPPAREGANGTSDEDITFTIAVGDEVEVTKRNTVLDVWSWPKQ